MAVTPVVAPIAALRLRSGAKGERESGNTVPEYGRRTGPPHDARVLSPSHHSGIRSILSRRNQMNDELLARVEREVLGWPGVFKKRDEDGVGGIGHVHDNDHADFRFPGEVRDELIDSGRVIAHPAFPNSRTTVSYRIRGAEDVPKVLELFRMNYERLKEAAEQKAELREE